MLDFVDPMSGVDEPAFEAALSKRVTDVLALPGFLAAQRFRVVTPPGADARPQLPFPKYLVLWETEAGHPQELQNRLIAATKAGEIKPLAADPTTAQSSWWVTVSPFITKDDFQR